MKLFVTQATVCSLPSSEGVTSVIIGALGEPTTTMLLLLAPTLLLASQIYSPKHSSVMFVILTQCCCVLLLKIVIVILFSSPARCLLFLIQETTATGLPDTLQHRVMSSPGPVYTMSWITDTRGGSLVEVNQ